MMRAIPVPINDRQAPPRRLASPQLPEAAARLWSGIFFWMLLTATTIITSLI